MAEDAKVNSFKAGLYLVATPIGNLRDLTLRALDLFEVADIILCEDTRVTRKLLQAYGLKKKTEAYHDHSDDSKRSRIVGMIQGGQVVVLVSDAGMPMVSDPGYKLVNACYDAGVYVSSLPGANSPLMALQLSGLPSDTFCFLGFLPNKAGPRKTKLEHWVNIKSTLIAFESGTRLLATLESVSEVLGEREIAVARELTKVYEEVRRGSPQALIAFYEENGAPKGEIVLVIGPPANREVTQDDIDGLLKEALQTMRVKDAAKHVAELLGVPKKDVYNRALDLKDDDGQ